MGEKDINLGSYTMNINENPFCHKILLLEIICLNYFKLSLRFFLIYLFVVLLHVWISIFLLPLWTDIDRSWVFFLNLGKILMRNINLLYFVFIGELAEEFLT